MPTKTYFIVHFPAKSDTGAGTNCWVKSFDEGNLNLQLTNDPTIALKFEKKQNATLLNASLKRAGAEGGIVQTQYMTKEQQKGGLWTFENPKPDQETETVPATEESSTEPVQDAESVVEMSPSSGSETDGTADPEDATKVSE